jgi:hypothetical protein
MTLSLSDCSIRISILQVEARRSLNDTPVEVTVGVVIDTSGIALHLEHRLFKLTLRDVQLQVELGRFML